MLTSRVVELYCDNVRSVIFGDSARLNSELAPTLNMPAFSRKKSRFSGKKSGKRQGSTSGLPRIEVR